LILKLCLEVSFSKIWALCLLNILIFYRYIFKYYEINHKQQNSEPLSTVRTYKNFVFYSIEYHLEFYKKLISKWLFNYLRVFSKAGVGFKNHILPVIRTWNHRKNSLILGKDLGYIFFFFIYFIETIFFFTCFENLASLAQSN
jgi:hypothetical protein